MDQQKKTQENEASEAFFARFAGLAGLWAILYTIAGRIGPQIPEEHGLLTFGLQAAVMAPLMAALRMVIRHPGMEREIRWGCRILFGMMTAALAVFLMAAIG